MQMGDILMKEWVVRGLTYGPLLLLLGCFAVLVVLTARIFVFCRRSRKFANRLEEYVYYILDDGHEDRQDAGKEIREEPRQNEEEKPALTKGQQEELLQEILGGFLS